METVFVGLGSNIDPESNLRRAIGMLKEYFPTMRCSSIRSSPAVEVTDQPDFLNAVAAIETSCSLIELKSMLQGIERALKKSVPYRYGPRTIDLDILLAGDQVLSLPSLSVPHPKMHERRFVLEPLVEIGAGDIVHPTLQRTIRSLLLDLR